MSSKLRDNQKGRSGTSNRRVRTKSRKGRHNGISQRTRTTTHYKGSGGREPVSINNPLYSGEIGFLPGQPQQHQTGYEPQKLRRKHEPYDVKDDVKESWSKIKEILKSVLPPPRQASPTRTNPWTTKQATTNSAPTCQRGCLSPYKCTKSKVPHYH